MVVRRLLAIAVFGGKVVCAPESAWAMHLPDPPEHRLVVGPSLAYGSIAGAADHPLYGLEATYAYFVFWGSAGARLWHDAGPTLLPHAEAGVYLGINVGVGASYILENERERRLAPHLFLGLPLPVYVVDAPWGPLEAGSCFVEPYYRPLWWQGNALHEVGLMFRITAFASGTKRLPPPPRPASPPLVY
jgi:hypothetical protein